MEKAKTKDNALLTTSKVVAECPREKVQLFFKNESSRPVLPFT